LHAANSGTSFVGRAEVGSWSGWLMLLWHHALCRLRTALPSGVAARPTFGVLQVAGTCPECEPVASSRRTSSSRLSCSLVACAVASPSRAVNESAFGDGAHLPDGQAGNGRTCLLQSDGSRYGCIWRREPAGRAQHALDVTDIASEVDAASGS
jgi:hypothetical protein